jgi:hypothetical protein
MRLLRRRERRSYRLALKDIQDYLFACQLTRSDGELYYESSKTLLYILGFSETTIR